MKIKTYEDMELTTVSQTILPQEVISMGLHTCIKKDTPDFCYLTEDQGMYLIEAGHMSPLEHASMSIYVKGISRSLLAQVTRHRTFKFTASSQRYQDYSDYEMVISNSVKQSEGFEYSFYKVQLEESMSAYKYAIEQGTPKGEARQLLPNAMAVNLLITADARNMVNFFRQRMCARCSEEMQIFANKWYAIALKWLPEVFKFVGPPCFMEGDCNQGKMKSRDCK